MKKVRKKGTRFYKDSYTELSLIIKGMCCEKGGGCSVVSSGVSKPDLGTVSGERVRTDGILDLRAVEVCSCMLGKCFLGSVTLGSGAG